MVKQFLRILPYAIYPAKQQAYFLSSLAPNRKVKAHVSRHGQILMVNFIILFPPLLFPGLEIKLCYAEYETVDQINCDSSVSIIK